jgi:hypothetical protein
MREELVLSHRASVALTGIFLLSLPSLSYLAIKYWQIDALGTPGLGLFAKLLVLVLLIYICKVMVIRTVQLISHGDFGLGEYLHNLFLTSKAAGILLIPIIAFAAFSSLSVTTFFLIAGCIVFGLFYFFRISRGIGNALSLRIPPLYIILYLCTLEILPLLLFYKLVSS